MEQTNTPVSRERQVSRKLWIREIMQGKMQTIEGESNSLQTVRGSAGRVNIMGVVIAREELPVSSLTIDDGTGQIIVRSFDQKLSYTVGSIIQIIGRPRQYQGELYIAAEAISRVDAAWLSFRKKELGEVQENIIEVIQEHKIEETKIEKLLRLIKELDRGDGADIDEVITVSKIPNAEQIIDNMLMQGDIFELRPGKVKIL